MAISNAEKRKARYDLLIELGFTPQEARQGRDWSASRILRETGFTRVTKQDWAIMSNKRNRKRLYPSEVEAFAIRQNREVGADDYSSFGFAFAYKYYVEDKTITQIKLELVYSSAQQDYFYTNIRPI